MNPKQKREKEQKFLFFYLYTPPPSFLFTAESLRAENDLFPETALPAPESSHTKAGKDIPSRKVPVGMPEARKPMPDLRQPDAGVLEITCGTNRNYMRKKSGLHAEVFRTSPRGFPKDDTKRLLSGKGIFEKKQREYV